ncbi:MULTISPECIES: fimbrial protein [Ralstonia]|jgi:minor fimbrial subunit|uniref:Laminin-binding fimbrial subunit ElfA n=1 Tax=Ralstonia flaminis TaxID=3058597 RepID=A0ABM9KC24_9RALS|nr:MULTISPECIES: fimbrial protein [unclassified Ralstonia]CAJ0821226.1 Laminin-binding fimbrial subunit ElfA [Ralstonia sp. LMG 18101]
MRQSYSSIRTLWLRLAVLALCGGASSAALAQSAVSVTGSLTAGTCQWGIDGPDHAVLLDPINVSQLRQGQVAGLKTFSLSLTNCAVRMVSATFTFSGTPDATDRLRYHNLGNAPGVAIELQSSDGRTIGADGTNNQRTATVTGDQITLPLRAGYWQVGERASSGSVESNITFAIQYN